MHTRLSAATFIAGCFFSFNAHATEWNIIEDIKLGSTSPPKGWICAPQDKIAKILNIKSCSKNKAGTIRGIPVSVLGAAYYFDHGGKAGIINIQFPAETTPKFGKLLEADLGPPTRGSKLTPQSVTLTWERKSYTVVLQRDDKTSLGHVTVTAEWIY